TLRVAVLTAPRRFLGSSEGPTLDASTTASTSARASVSPSPVTRSIPRDLDTSTTSTSRALRRCTTREPAVPVAPMTAIFMSFRSSFSRTPKRATSRDVSPETADQASGGEAPRKSGRGQAGERSSDRRRAPAWSTLRVQSGPYMSRFSVGDGPHGDPANFRSAVRTGQPPGDRLRPGGFGKLNPRRRRAGLGLPKSAGHEGLRPGQVETSIMRLSQAVEWTLHSCVNLAWVQGPVPAARLARLYQLPAAYLNKQLQALVRADILVSVPGAHGGFRLARDPADISLLDVVVAVEGPEEAFRCTQIVQRGPGGDPNVDYRHFCAISQSMRRADLAWR